MGRLRWSLLLLSCGVPLLPGAAQAAPRPACRGALVASGSAVRIDLRCPGGIRRLSGSLDADVGEIRAARAGSHSLRCALAGDAPTRRFTCSGRRVATGRLRLRLLLAGAAPCTLQATLRSRGPAGDALRETQLAERIHACPVAPPPAAPQAPPTPAPTPTPAPAAAPTPAAPTPTTPSPTVTTQAAPTAGSYVVSYEGVLSYALHRKDSFPATSPFPASTSAFDEQQQLGWSTTYAPVALAPGATQDTEVDGQDLLMGTASNHQDDEAVDTTVRSCSSTGPPTEDPTDGRPPQLVAHPIDATHVRLDLEAVDVAVWPGACDDGEQPELFLFDQDPVLTSSVLDASVTTTYAALAAGSVTVPTTTPAVDQDHDCRAPELQLTECSSDLRGTGSVRIAPVG